VPCHELSSCSDFSNFRGVLASSAGGACWQHRHRQPGDLSRCESSSWFRRRLWGSGFRVWVVYPWKSGRGRKDHDHRSRLSRGTCQSVPHRTSSCCTGQNAHRQWHAAGHENNRDERKDTHFPACWGGGGGRNCGSAARTICSRLPPHPVGVRCRGKGVSHGTCWSCRARWRSRA